MRYSHLTASLIPFLLLACGSPSGDTGPGAASDDPSGAVSLAARAHDDTSRTPLHPMAGSSNGNNQLINMACQVATSAAGDPGACSVLSGALQIIGFIQGLSSGPTETDTILADVQQLNADMQQLDTQITNLNTAFNDAAWEIEGTQQLQNQTTIHTEEANARDALTRLSTWIQGGKTDADLIASIDSESSMAAMDLTVQSLYQRVPAVEGAAPVFDLRQALLSYLYALTVRLTVINAEDPNYRCVNDENGFGCPSPLPYNAELGAHLAFLNDLIQWNKPNIALWNELEVSGNTYTMCSSAQDLNSAFLSQSNGQGNAPFGGAPSECVGPYTFTAAEANDGMAYLEYWDNWNVEEEMGIHAIQAMAATVATDMTTDFPLEPRLCLGTCPPPPPPPTEVGPLVSNAGYCLSNGHGAYPFTSGLQTVPCTDFAEYETWQTAGPNQTSWLGLSDQSACVDLDLWYAGNGTIPDLAACSGSSGEQFTFTSTGQLKWGRDESLCLTATGENDSAELQTCNGSAAQVWGRVWPRKIPIVVLK